MRGEVMHPADQKLEDERLEHLAQIREQRLFELAKSAVPTMIGILYAEGAVWKECDAAAACREFAYAVLAALDAKAGSESA